MTSARYSKDWYVFNHENPEMRTIDRLPTPPPWRNFQNPNRNKYYKFELEDDEVAVVNAALYLRRPLLVTGPPGSGKSSLATTIAEQLNLGEVLKWPITSRTVVKDGQYRYDAIGRLQSERQQDYLRRNQLEGNNTISDNESISMGQFLQLGPLGTAFADSSNQPRVLLIDEIDKSDIDLPNDLLNLFEDGYFEIPELARMALHGITVSADSVTVEIRMHNSLKTVPITNGHVTCKNFPIIIVTSNGERELPAPFLRRCLRIDIAPPSAAKLERIVASHFLHPMQEMEQDQLAEFHSYVERLAKELSERRQAQNEFVATDQLLNAIYLRLHDADGLQKGALAEIIEQPSEAEVRKVLRFVLHTISRASQL